MKPVQHEVLTAGEAAHFLRIVDDPTDPTDAGRQAINRLVDDRRLRACLLGKHRRYSIVELRRFVSDATAGRKYPENGEVS